MKQKLHIVNQRMLQWMEYSIHTKVVGNQKEWCEAIGFLPNNMHSIRQGIQGFSFEHVKNAAELINGNLNWLWNLEDNMLRTSKPLSPMQLLKQAVVAVENELSARNGTKIKTSVTTRVTRSKKQGIK
jgi:hypothetical protein